MKKLVSVTEVSGEGFEALLGEEIVVWSLNYIYSGKLVGVNTNDILLEDAVVVYETGDLSAKAFKDAQKVPKPLYLRTATIEAYYAR